MDSKLTDRTTVYLEEDVKKQAKILAIKEERSLSEIINELLKKYIRDNT